jgi:eukaryotic-like serine/threonine-protein kinase
MTLTPTLTPTPNATQIFLATQLPTANLAFTPQVRTHDDGSEQVFVPAGAFIAGDQTGSGFSDEIVHQVYTDGFWIDRYLVTNSDFAECPVDICGRPDDYTSHVRKSGYYDVPAFANYPVMHISWSQAEAFCEWRGGRLPKEAEWEKAAGWDPVSGKMQIYPWGNEPPDDTRANYDNVDLDTTEVGSYPAGVSSVGAYDMAGNIWEWVYDWYGPYDLSQQINPSGPPQGERKVTRGGSWSNTTQPTHLRVANRGVNNPANANNETGFRCVFPE